LTNRKTANVIEKTAVYHTINDDSALIHTSKKAKIKNGDNSFAAVGPFNNYVMLGEGEWSCGA